MNKKELKIYNEIWFQGTPEEVIKQIESLQAQGYEDIEAVCKAYAKKVVVFN